MADVNIVGIACSSLTDGQKVTYRHFRLNFIGINPSLTCNKKLSPLLKTSTI